MTTTATITPLTDGHHDLVVTNSMGKLLAADTLPSRSAAVRAAARVRLSLPAGATFSVTINR